MARPSGEAKGIDPAKLLNTNDTVDLFLAGGNVPMSDAQAAFLEREQLISDLVARHPKADTPADQQFRERQRRVLGLE